MKTVCISTNNDVLTGMRLAGVEGTLVTTKEEALFSFTAARQDPLVGLVLICQEAAQLLQEQIQEAGRNGSRPLLLQIPSPGSAIPKENPLAKAIRDAVGVG